MSRLTVYHVSNPDVPDKVLNHLEDITCTLAARGVRFERWQANIALPVGAGPDQVREAYQAVIDQWMAAEGCRAQDILVIDNDVGVAASGVEHRRAVSELRLFVAGRVLVYLHIDDYVYAVLCERHDVLGVPAGIAQWMDAGERGRVSAIQLFENEAGSAQAATGADIAERFARLEE